MELELLLCRFIRSLREGNFNLYVQVCDELCAWFHVMDHTNYAHWLPIHVRDMVELPEKHPAIYEEFLKGNFVVQRAEHKFSLIAKDQSHEQSNKILQSCGGAAGLYESSEALTLFMLAGPDSARLVQEFEAVYSYISSPSSMSHREEAHSLQVKFMKDVKSFTAIMKSHGNPFLSVDHDLTALDTQEIVETEVSESLTSVHKVGMSLHLAYVEERLEKATKPISDIIPRTNILTFANRPDRKAKRNHSIQKQNMTLITQLFLSLQSRPDADMAEFFKYENQREPPSISNQGLLRSGTKVDILECPKSLHSSS